MKNTSNGTAIDTNAENARISLNVALRAEQSTICLVITVVLPELSDQHQLPSRSFHVHKNWKIANDAKAKAQR
jgi:hypothetical protein